MVAHGPVLRLQPGSADHRPGRLAKRRLGLTRPSADGRRQPAARPPAAVWSSLVPFGRDLLRHGHGRLDDVHAGVRDGSVPAGRVQPSARTRMRRQDLRIRTELLRRTQLDQHLHPSVRYRPLPGHVVSGAPSRRDLRDHDLHDRADVLPGRRAGVLADLRPGHGLPLVSLRHRRRRSRRSGDRLCHLRDGGLPRRRHLLLGRALHDAHLRERDHLPSVAREASESVRRLDGRGEKVTGS